MPIDSLIQDFRLTRGNCWLEVRSDDSMAHPNQEAPQNCKSPLDCPAEIMSSGEDSLKMNAKRYPAPGRADMILAAESY